MTVLSLEEVLMCSKTVSVETVTLLYLSVLLIPPPPLPLLVASFKQKKCSGTALQICDFEDLFIPPVCVQK